MTGNLNAGRLIGCGLVLRTAVLAAALAPTLAAAYVFISSSPALPTKSQWAIWRVPVLEGVAGALVLGLFWTSRRPSSRSWATDSIAAALGVAAAIVGVASVLLFAFAVDLRMSGASRNATYVLHRMTDPRTTADAVAFSALTLLPGLVGYWLARRRAREFGRVSLAAVALRFSLVGITIGLLLGAWAVSAVVWRTLIWG
jgi:hypothetical protein